MYRCTVHEEIPSVTLHFDDTVFQTRRLHNYLVGGKFKRVHGSPEWEGVEGRR